MDLVTLTNRDVMDAIMRSTVESDWGIIPVLVNTDSKFYCVGSASLVSLDTSVGEMPCVILNTTGEGTVMHETNPENN